MQKNHNRDWEQGYGLDWERGYLASLYRSAALARTWAIAAAHDAPAHDALEKFADELVLRAERIETTLGDAIG